ncbi:MAG: type VI secretion system baseplate subunit TssG [Pseudomonadota bacterium]
MSDKSDKIAQQTPEQNLPAIDPYLSRVADAPWKGDFFSVLRRIDAQDPTRARLGQASRMRDDPVRIGQAVQTIFAPSSLASFRLGGKVHRLWVNFLGLFGPQGGLPLHLTEYIRDRMRNEEDHTFADFINTFSHRFYTFFYRIWAHARPTTGCDRNEQDPFADWLSCLIGMGTPGLRARDHLADHTRLRFAGMFASLARHPDGLAALIASSLGLPVRVCEFEQTFLSLQPNTYSRLGRQACTLGSQALLGARVRNFSCKIRLVIGPLLLADFRRLLPTCDATSGTLPCLISIVRAYLGDTWRWDARLVLKAHEVPALALTGDAQLGWTTWLPAKTRMTDSQPVHRDDVVLAGVHTYDLADDPICQKPSRII